MPSNRSPKQIGKEAGRNFARRLPRYESPEPLSAVMGKYAGDPSPAVDLPGRENYVWIRVHQFNDQPMMCYSPDIRPWPDLPVLVEDRRDTYGELVICGVNPGAFGGPGRMPGNSGAPPWDRSSLVYKRQIVDFHSHPAGGLNVGVYADWFPVRGGRRYYAGGTIDLTAAVPSTGSRYVTVYLEFIYNADGTITEQLGYALGPVLGALGPGGYPTSPDDVEGFIPVGPVGAFDTGSILLQAGQTLIKEVDFYDVRSIWNPNGYGEAATLQGQVMYSVDGIVFSAELPLTNEAGWMVDDETGLMLVVDIL